MKKREFANLLRSVKEAAAISRGQMKPAREFRLTWGKLVEVAPEARPRRMESRTMSAGRKMSRKTGMANAPPDVASIRKHLGLSQAEFADVFKIAVRTLRNWEQGIRQPEGPAQVLLQVIERQPKAVLNALHGKAS